LGTGGGGGGGLHCNKHGKTRLKTQTCRTVVVKDIWGVGRARVGREKLKENLSAGGARKRKKESFSRGLTIKSTDPKKSRGVPRGDIVLN